MDLKEIATVSGKGGLFRVVKPTRNGVILESVDSQKSKLVAGPQYRVSLLKEISVYTTGKETSRALEDVLVDVHAKYGKELPVNAKSSTEELSEFMENVVPDYDQERVYTSDIKKLVSWYSILVTNFPEFFNKKASEEAEPAKQEPVAEENTKSKEKSAKPQAAEKKA